MKPTAKSIRVVIDAWVSSRIADNNNLSGGGGVMEQAEMVLDTYEDFLDSLGPPEDPPGVLDDVRDVYRSMLFGWSKHGDPEQAQE